MNSSKPTPPSGLPAAVEAEIVAQKGDGSRAILDGILKLQKSQDDLREESRKRGEETSSRFDSLDRKVDRLSEEDDSLRKAHQRLEQRQASTDEEVRIFKTEMREELRKDREARDQDKTSMTSTLEGMKKHIELSSKANAESVASAVAQLHDAAARFDAAATNSAEREGAQEKRLDTLEKNDEALKNFAGVVCAELDVDAPEGIEKPALKEGEDKKAGKLAQIASDAALLATKTTGNRKVTWAAVALAGVQVLWGLVKLVDYLVTRGQPVLPP